MFKTYTNTDNTLELTLLCNMKPDTHEDDIVDVEICRVNSQSKCVVIDGI
jgi:hypothetical protein